MGRIFTKATQLIGHTPLLMVENYMNAENIEGVVLLAMLDYLIPAGSVMD